MRRCIVYCLFSLGEAEEIEEKNLEFFKSLVNMDMKNITLYAYIFHEIDEQVYIPKRQFYLSR